MHLGGLYVASGKESWLQVDYIERSTRSEYLGRQITSFA